MDCHHHLSASGFVVSMFGPISLEKCPGSGVPSVVWMSHPFLLQHVIELCSWSEMRPHAQQCRDALCATGLFAYGASMRALIMSANLYEESNPCSHPVRGGFYFSPSAFLQIGRASCRERV